MFRTGGPFRAIYAVRTGSANTRLFDRDGNEQVLGFYLPGEVAGLNAIYPEHFTLRRGGTGRHPVLPLLVPRDECAGRTPAGGAAAPVPADQQGAGRFDVAIMQ